MVYFSVLSPSDGIVLPSSRHHIYLARLLPSVVLGREHSIVVTSSLVPEIRGVPTVTAPVGGSETTGTSKQDVYKNFRVNENSNTTSPKIIFININCDKNDEK